MLAVHEIETCYVMLYVKFNNEMKNLLDSDRN